MLLNNCKLCSRVFKIYTKSNEVCADCMKMQEAQYKVTLTRIEKLFRTVAVKEIIERVGFEPHRLNAYLQYRFIRSSKYAILDGNLKGYCFICNVRNYYPYESSCLDCLQRILAAIENRGINRVETLGSGRKIDIPVETAGSSVVMTGTSLDETFVASEQLDESVLHTQAEETQSVSEDVPSVLSRPRRFCITRPQ
jgi:hypothetical protein